MGWIEDYSECHPHMGLRMRSPVSSAVPSLNQPPVRFDAGSFKAGLELAAAALLIARHDQHPSRDRPALSFVRRDV
jgi:hypothetical protein